MAVKVSNRKRVFLIKFGGFLISVFTILQFIIVPDFSNPIKNLFMFYLIAWGFVLLFTNLDDKNSMLNKSIKNNWFGMFILVFLAILAFTLPNFVATGLKNDKIKSITLSEKCVATINLKSGKTEIIDIESDVISKECKIKPVVSRDGKYAAFDLSLIIEDPDQKSGKSANNSSIVYMLESDKWINAYNHGAGESTSINFNENDDLVVNIRYEGQDLAPWVVKKTDFEEILKNEEERALELVKQQKDVVNWLKNFDNKSYMSANRESKAVVQIDQHDGDNIVIHVYEQFLTDGHRATFNWYKYSRFSSIVTKEFSY